MKDDSLPIVMTPKDLEKVLSLSRNSVYELLHSEDFPSFKVGKQFRINRDQFLDWSHTNKKRTVA